MTTPPLSPAAEAVLNALVDASGDYIYPRYSEMVAAVLRTLACQDESLIDGEDEMMPSVRAVRTDLILSIADELEPRR